MTANGSGTGYRNLTVDTALELARNSEGAVEPVVANFLERALGALWNRIQAQPYTYLMNRTEFSLFSYFYSRLAEYEVAQRAVKRFWDNYQGDPNGVT